MRASSASSTRALLETMTRACALDVDVDALSMRLARATSARVDLERALARAREDARDAAEARDAATRARDAATAEARRERACALEAIDALEACATSERAWREKAETWRGKFERARDAARRARRALELVDARASTRGELANGGRPVESSKTRARTVSSKKTREEASRRAALEATVNALRGELETLRATAETHAERARVESATNADLRARIAALERGVERETRAATARGEAAQRERAARALRELAAREEALARETEAKRACEAALAREKMTVELCETRERAVREALAESERAKNVVYTAYAELSRASRRDAADDRPIRPIALVE